MTREERLDTIRYMVGETGVHELLKDIAETLDVLATELEELDGIPSSTTACLHQKANQLRQANKKLEKIN